MKKIVSGITAIFFLTTCNSGSGKKEVGFYDYSKIDYIYRLPLIEPYEITSPDNGVNWILAFKGTSPPSHGVQFLTKVGMKDSVFVVYSPRDLSFSSDHPNVWAVVDVEKKEEKLFTNEWEYKAYLTNRGMGDISLYEINTVFKRFDNDKTLLVQWPRK